MTGSNEAIENFIATLSGHISNTAAELIAAFQPVVTAVQVFADLQWYIEEELCYREYTKRMNGGAWHWRQRSWRKLNRMERAAARQWWVTYGRAATREMIVCLSVLRAAEIVDRQWPRRHNVASRFRP